MDAKDLLDSTPNPITTHPGARAMFALFHLKDGCCMAVLPVAEPGSLAWLQLDGEGTFMLKSGTLGPASATPPVRAGRHRRGQRRLPRLFRRVGEGPFPSLHQRENRHQGREDLSGTVQVPGLVQLGAV